MLQHKNGDKLIVTHLFYIKVGDIVIVNSEGLGSVLLAYNCHRGQTVDIDFATGTVTVDGNGVLKKLI